jgi:hypothetical protein
MPTVFQTILAEIVRLGNSPISDKTVPNLQTLLAKVLDYADSLVAKGTTVDDLADFQETLDDLTGVADTLDAACDAYDMADDEDSREEVLEAAGEALADLARHLQDLDSIAQYIPTTEAEVANGAPNSSGSDRFRRINSEQPSTSSSTKLERRKNPLLSWLWLKPRPSRIPDSTRSAIISFP